MKKTMGKRFLLLSILSLFVLTAAGCNVEVGVGVGVGVAYPGPWYGPWGGGVYVGGPIYP